MAGSTTRRLRVLARRRDYLTSQLTQGEGNSYDRAEASALSWAIKKIESQRHSAGR